MKRLAPLLVGTLGLTAIGSASAAPPPGLVPPPRPVQVAPPPVAPPPPVPPVAAGSRADAPKLQLLASGVAWRTYHVSGKLLQPDSQTLIAADEPIVVIDSAAGITGAPVSPTLKTTLRAELASLPSTEQAGTIIVRKNIDDRVLTKGGGPTMFAGCANEDKVYTRQFASSTPLHYAQGKETGSFTGNVNVDGTASGNVTAQVTMRVIRTSIPLLGCITYWGHLKSASLTGRGDVVADAKVAGSFAAAWHKSVTVVEPTLYDDWISIEGLPVKITVTLPIEAGVDASAKVDASFDTKVEAHGTFAIQCTSSSCDGSKSTTFGFAQNGRPSLGINVRANVNPWAQASVKVALYDGVAAGKIGVRATLGADFWGYAGNTCGDANHDGVNETVSAATLDASVLVDLRADVSFFGSDKPYAWNLLNQHVAFVDLLGTSSALTPIFYADSASGLTAVMRGRMRPCYPYSDPVHFTFDWTDGSPAETIDSPAPTLFSHAHTFRTSRPEVAFHPERPKVTAVADSKGRPLNATTVSPTLFQPVMAAP
jgi:hypothetical protein